MAFRENTTFIIGAGASAEFGLPVGSQLASKIKKTVSTIGTGLGIGYFDQFINRKFRDLKHRSDAIDAMRAIRDGIHTAVSIDAFIHRMHGNSLIQSLGKALIAFEVLEAEKASTLLPAHWEMFKLIPDGLISTGANQAKNPDYTWISHFFKILADGVDDPKKLGAGITIICFNYDRCIEQYLMHTISAAYGIELKEALDIVEKTFNIIHPYGSLGRITVEPDVRSRNKVAFGYDIENGMDIEDIAHGIKTYTEQTHDVQNVKAIQTAITFCKNLVFLGFGFNNQNLDLLRVKHVVDTDTAKRNVYATGKGLYQQIDDTLKRRIMQLFIDPTMLNQWPQRVHIEYDTDCTELFRIHDMNMSKFTQNVVSVDENQDPPVSIISPYRGFPF